MNNKIISIYSLFKFQEQAPSLATIYLWFKEFERERLSIKQQKGAGRPPTAVTEENIVDVKEIIENDNQASHAIIEHQLRIGSSAVRTIIHDHLHLKKVVSRFVPHQLSEFRKAERVKICHENLNLSNMGATKSFPKLLQETKHTFPFFMCLPAKKVVYGFTKMRKRQP
ncbi:hypothetical protein ILUMI_01821 [Ignelater luminosus]|uniref:Transposase n=1 Tax=Ignelater luminosus TaxID=2038154 RepID=A0A8K0GNU3_IGNLU|nr:hypothetical protein ILUMI_01821 [Ignelater luminosus]